MSEQDLETLVEIRDILVRLHDSRVGNRDAGISLTEMAAIRDSVRRLSAIMVSNATPKRRAFKTPKDSAR